MIEYTTYMRGLAASHRELRHRPEEKHFFRGELQEFFQQFRSEVRFPCLIAEGSDNEYIGTEEAMMKRRNTSFIVADRYDQHDDYDEIQLKMTKCERIAEQVMGQLLKGGEGCPFERVEAESINGQYLQNEADRYVGYRMNFAGIAATCMYEVGSFSC